ncbi:BZ3500_MvSof-1268-A1-R1_Chr2-2g04803 [Microbotryum saponariae]|uniref:BZ3500_MvSof-1268-A1-R1_Chr2-2g04803 protein n=1 Tax=Microbotryum saponariae TaxID=289078 RepID=A0A2X0K5K2_9BASI|nr:BZ3500_MvSof-1268-A1-R1_Chr2-2g04803 [Microbotryum saponariae]SDA00201.1 BZ3501_MvSof-1269-A2-R1_Chr2-2g04477 [Microbotryum saponariae]
MQGRIRFGPKRGINTKAKSRASPIVSGPQPVCQACQTQFSRYTCPSCNFHYCTLTCYRSPSHSTCSEAFDRQSLVDEIRSSEGTSREQQKAMMEMLKRFEEEQGQENEEDADEVTQRMLDRLEGVDLDSIEPSQLLEYLSPAQRAEFEDLLQASTKVEALMEAHDELKKPWWEETEGVVVEEDEENEDEENAFTKKTIRPAILPPESLPPLKLCDDGRPLVGPGLLNNIVAVLLAYVYVVRTYSLSSLSTLIPSTMDHQEVYRVLVHLVPFLTTRSTFIFSSIKEAIEKVFSTEGQEDPSTIFQITQDVARLLTPSPVINVQDDDHHPFVNTLAALADLKAFFGSVTRGERLNSKGIKTEAKQASMKLRFYYAFLAKLGEGVSTLRTLGEEVEKVGRGVAGMWEMKRVESERKGMEGKQRGAKVVGERSGPIIEEIAEEEGDGKVK